MSKRFEVTKAFAQLRILEDVLMKTVTEFKDLDAKEHKILDSDQIQDLEDFQVKFLLALKELELEQEKKE